MDFEANGYKITAEIEELPRFMSAMVVRIHCVGDGDDDTEDMFFRKDVSLSDGEWEILAGMINRDAVRREARGR
jgi:predicted ATP-dependent endonuclease of OLD family